MKKTCGGSKIAALAEKIRSPILIALLLSWLAVGTGTFLLEKYLVVEGRPGQADALVLMAGNPSERLPVLARLYNEGFSDRILLTNDGILGAWSKEHDRNLFLVEWDKLNLINRGIKEEAIVPLSFSHSGTIYDALSTRKYVYGTSEINSLLIVTSDYHTRRTLWAFQRVFSEYPVKIRVYPAKTAEAVRSPIKRFGLLFAEFFKLVFYRLAFLF